MRRALLTLLLIGAVVAVLSYLWNTGAPMPAAADPGDLAGGADRGEPAPRREMTGAPAELEATASRDVAVEEGADGEKPPGEAFTVLCFVVTNEAGMPLDGVRVAKNENAGVHHSEGRGHVCVFGDEETTYHAELEGYQRARFRTGELPFDARGRRHLVMKGANVLEIHVESAHEGLVRGLDVRLDGERPLFIETDAWSPFRPLPGTRVSQPYRNTYHGRTEDGFCVYSLEDGPVVRVQALHPHRPMRVSVRDKVGNLVVEQVVPPLGEVERRVVRLIVFDAGGRLRGTVQDEEGRAVAGAQVDVDGEACAESAEDGSFHFRPLYASGTVEVVVSRDGYVRQVLTTDPARDLTVVLEAGRTVEVRVRDEAGNELRRFRDLVARDAAGAEWDFERARGRSGALLRDLPTGEVTVALEVYGAVYETQHDTRVPVAELVVPVQGELDVEWELGTDFDMAMLSGNARVVLRNARGEDVKRWTLRTKGNSHTFQPVAPGEYDVFLELYSDRRGEWERACDPVRVGVEAGARAHARVTSGG